MAIAKVIRKYTIGDQPNGLDFWLLRSYEERIDALEEIRSEYNKWRYDRAEQRFQRVLKITEQQ